MAFDSYEESVEAACPIELYILAVGSYTYRLHTSIEAELIVGGETYTPLAGLSRQRLEPGDNDLEMELPAGHDFPLMYTLSAPGQQATVTIIRLHRGDTADCRVIYKGVVRQVEFSKNGAMAILRLSSVANAFERTIPTRTYQAGCNHVLFDEGCQLARTSYLYSGQVTDVNGNTITVSGLEAAKGDDWSTAGYVTIGVQDLRMILDQSGDVLTLVLPFYTPVLGENVTVYAGCRHDIDTCNSKFGNVINYGGFKYVPSKNIFITGIK